MDSSNFNHNTSNVATIQPSRHNSKSIDPLAKIRPIISKKPHLVQSLLRSKTIQITSGFKIPNTQIQSTNDPSCEPLVTISDNEQSDEEVEDFVLPIQKLTKEELREELKTFQSTNNTTHALLANDNDDDDTGELQFRTQQPLKRCICCDQYPFSFKNSSCIIL